MGKEEIAFLVMMNASLIEALFIIIAIFTGSMTTLALASLMSVMTMFWVVREMLRVLIIARKLQSKEKKDDE